MCDHDQRIGWKLTIICFWPKYIMFELRKYRGVMFDGTQDWYKIRRKLACASKNDIGKSQNWDFDGILLSKVGNVWG